MTRKILRILVNTALAAVVVFIGIQLAAYFKASSVEPPRQEVENKGTLVEVEPARAVVHEPVITGYGTVIPSRTATIRPQVTGRVVAIADDLVIGGRVAAGTTLVRLETRDYRLAIDELETAVSQARASLELERGREAVAEAEWEIFEEQAESRIGDLGAEYEDLARREPQIRSASAQVEAARARLARARLDLQRTTLEAPFNALVQQETVEVGDLLTPQNTVATLVGTDTFWVQVSVPLEQLPLIDVPEVNVGSGNGSPAVITLDADTVVTSRSGRVVRLLGELDPVGRMARLLVAIDDPLEAMPGELPILLGSYVRVDIATRDPVRGIELPRKAIHEGDLVYVYDANDQLDIREVTPLWRLEDSVIVSPADLRDGDLVIVSPLAAPLQGMKLRRGEAPPPSTDASDNNDDDDGDPPEGTLPRPEDPPGAGSRAGDTVDDRDPPSAEPRARPGVDSSRDDPDSNGHPAQTPSGAGQPPTTFGPEEVIEK